MKQLITLILIGFSQLLMAQDGYKLWLQYAEVDNPKVVEQYKKYNTKVQLDTTTATGTVIHNELNLALGGMLAQQAVLSSEQPTLVILKYSALPQNLKKEFEFRLRTHPRWSFCGAPDT